MSALTMFVAYAPHSSYDEDKIEAYYVGTKEFYSGEHTFYTVLLAYSL